MTITFQIPRVLQQYSGGQLEFPVEAVSIRAVLDEVRRVHPNLHACICDETGKVRRHINLFVNHDLVRDRDGRDTRLRSGDVVSVFQAVSGG